MANPDRLTALDASFLHLERANGVHMHVASVMVFEGEIPAYDEFLEAIESRLHLVPRYRQRLAFGPAQPGPAGVGRRPALQRALPRAPHGAAAPGLRAAAQAPRRARVLAAARPRQAAVGDLARRQARGRPLRADLQDPPRAGRRRLGRGHHHRAVRRRARCTAARAARARRGCRGRCRAAPSCSARRCSSAPPLPTEIARGARAVLRGAAPGARAGSSTTPPPSARWPPAASTRRPASPLNVAIGPHRRFDWVDGDLDASRRSRTRSAARSTTSCSPSSRWRSAAACATAAFPTDELELKAMVPVSVRADAERGALGNRSPRCARRCRSGARTRSSAFALVHAAMGELKESGQAVGAPGAHRPARTSRRRRSWPRPRACSRASASSTSWSPTCPARSSRSTCSGARCVAIYPMVPLAENLALGIAIMSYDGQLNFGLLRRLRRDGRPRRPRRRPARGDRELAEAAGLPSEAEEAAPPGCGDRTRARPGARARARRAAPGLLDAALPSRDALAPQGRGPRAALDLGAFADRFAPARGTGRTAAPRAAGAPQPPAAVDRHRRPRARPGGARRRAHPRCGRDEPARWRGGDTGPGSAVPGPGQATTWPWASSRRSGSTPTRRPAGPHIPDAGPARRHAA